MALIEPCVCKMRTSHLFLDWLIAGKWALEERMWAFRNNDVYFKWISAIMEKGLFIPPLSSPYLHRFIWRKEFSAGFPVCSLLACGSISCPSRHGGLGFPDRVACVCLQIWGGAGGALVFSTKPFSWMGRSECLVVPEVKAGTVRPQPLLAGISLPLGAREDSSAHPAKWCCRPCTGASQLQHSHLHRAALEWCNISVILP